MLRQPHAVNADGSFGIDIDAGCLFQIGPVKAGHPLDFIPAGGGHGIGKSVEITRVSGDKTPIENPRLSRIQSLPIDGKHMFA